MFNLTFVNLAPDARATAEGSGPVDHGQVTPEELTALLDAFAEIDPVQNMKVDPEIRIQTKRDRYIVRTGQKKLFLYDARKQSEPAYVLSAAEIIAELDGTAAARRTAAPTEMSRVLSTEPLPDESDGKAESTALPIPESAPWPWALIALTLLLSGYIVYAGFFPSDGVSHPPLVALGQAERLSEDGVLTGVYMTGSQPGQHGIVILGDGKMKLFQVNAQAAPGVVFGTYRLGRLEGKLHLATDQPGGLITVRDRDTLDYGGEAYKRIP